MKKLFRRVPCIVLMMLVCANVNVNATDCGDSVDSCGKQTEWNEFETVRLRMKQEDMPVPASWYMQSSRKNGDLQIDIDIPDIKKPQHGTIMMVEGRTFVSKGVALAAGREIDALDTPLLYVILAGKVLSRALPGGPSGLSGKQQITHEDKKAGIQFATPSADGFISPPWSVTGFVQRNANQAVDFDLVLTWNESAGHGKKTATVALSGQLKHSADFEIDSNLPLEGWTVFGVGPIVEQTNNGKKFDYGATPAKTRPKTIADIRQEIALKNSPGEPDLAVNLAGFWKTECGNTFGLRVKPADKPGMYTVTFCGPGGCGDEHNERKTFITGDSGYKVVSAVEVQVGREGDRMTYKKCTDKMLP